MEIQRYRLNRSSGLIYRIIEYPFRLEEVGEALDIIILHATPPVRGQPFANMPEQDWIGLCFLDPELNWAFTLLNSGKSQALRSFLNYTNKHELSSVTTRISLISQTSHRGTQWFSYTFEAFPLPNINVSEIFNHHYEYPLIDPTVNLEFPPANRDEILSRIISQQTPIDNTHEIFDMEDIETRSKFLIWN
ncbi:MAG TPA: hypothetical protein DCL61_27290 [Cyanobacteria bacterium UBA12227]|nr:hypothetical protein [Cyanobacteria bacterium UBA12227]HAX88334.1 hypothetical protein [Cyanobacteria bacterium UBA11370]HBY81144.1 hypothetical protein [Cyanobacteria bacterium UBA11148]